MGDSKPSVPHVCWGSSSPGHGQWVRVLAADVLSLAGGGRLLDVVEETVVADSVVEVGDDVGALGQVGMRLGVCVGDGVGHGVACVSEGRDARVVTGWDRQVGTVRYFPSARREW
jgi:hypothetical protein